VVFSDPEKQPTLKERKTKKNTSESATGYTTEKIQRDTLSRKLCADI